MSSNTAFILAWLIGMAAAVALAYNGNVLLAFFVLVICASLRGIET